jgi:hypothetical protein
LKPPTVADRSTGSRCCGLILTALLLGTSASMADSESGSSDFRINGFGTAGISQVDAPSGWEYRRVISQRGNDSGTRANVDSRLGMQINYAPMAQFEVVGQVIINRLDSAANIGDRFSLAFAAYRPDADWTVRVGRVNLDAYLLSDHRDVGFTYEYARPPVEFYTQLPGFLDGGDVSRVWNASGTLWRLKGLAGNTSVASGDYRQEIHSLIGIVASRQDGGLLIRASLIHGKLASSPPALQPLTDALGEVSGLPIANVAAQARSFQSLLAFRDVRTTYAALGAEYEHADWLWSSEVTRVTGVRGFDAGYVSIGRRFGAVSVFGLISAVASTQRVVSTPAWGAELATLIGPSAAMQADYLAGAAALATNSLASKQHTVSFGARWNLTSQVAVKAQWDHIRVNADGSELWENATLDSGRANVYSLVLDFVF